jgi:predicted ATPase/DNA-binding CsgD family transcriptional regulator
MVTNGGSLIGRESELAELRSKLAAGSLVTITGAGGCGKTRLALEAAERIASVPGRDGYAVAALADVSRADRLIEALVAAAGVRERFGRTPHEVLVEHLRARQLLLVLDNCEHLLPGLATIAGELRHGAPSLRLLATSREPLAIDGENVLRLGPLSLPGPDDDDVGAVVRSDAGRMFVEHAVRRNAAFALTPRTARAVVRICRELDGLPLALELAAARLDTLGVEQIARELGGQGPLSTAGSAAEPPRHSSLRASLDWSYRLLDEAERGLLRRLSVFSGGFTADAAQGIAAPSASVTHIHDLLQALERKGLLVPASTGAPERWRLLSTVAEYAGEQLTKAGERDELAERHLAWFTTWAAQADDRLLQDGREPIDAEGPNLRRALDHALARDPSSGLAIAASLMRHWILAEHFHEARSICMAVLAAVDDSADAQARAIVLCGAALVSMLSEDYEGALTNTQAGLALLDASEEHSVRALCLLFSSMVLIQTGVDLHGGLASAERAVQLAEQHKDDPLGLAWALVTLAVAAMLCERFVELDEAYEAFLAIPTACEHRTLRAWAEQAAAWAQVSVGSPERALAHIERASTLEGDWPSMTHFQVLGFRIHALARVGRTAEAIATGKQALKRARESGALQAVPAIELALATAELLHGALDSAADRANGLLRMPQMHTLVLARETLARIALARNEPDEAQRHATELEAIAQRTSCLRYRALAEYIHGRAALQNGENDRGRDLLHAALARCAGLGLEREAADVLDELALLAADAGEVERCARLAAAGASTRGRLGCVPAPASAERLDAARTRLAAQAGDGWDAAWAQGEQAALADAIAYARRGRGRRRRSTAGGWPSLTDTERDVALLAASGKTNPQIAEQLFIARGTVKMHLSSVYRKLNVVNRTELASASARGLAAQTPKSV